MEDQSPAGIKEIKKLLSLDNRELRENPIFAKPLRFSKGSLEKKIFTSLKLSKLHSPLNDSLIERYNFKEELRKLLLTTNEVKELPGSILRLTPFHSYEACHLLVHEKGKPVGQNYLHEQTGYEETKLINIQNFNSLFSLIKKSKNKIFNQNILLKEDLEIVGNFLAKEIDFKNHSVIYIISKNSFLPPTQEEQDLFQNLSLHLQPLLFKILDKEKNDLKKEVLNKSLMHFPEKIFIKKKGVTIFTNDSSNENLEKSHIMIFPLDNDEQTVMELSNFSKDSISTEIYHSQRVSLLGELLNTLQHELSNPLFGLNLTGTLLSQDARSEDIKETLSDICQNANRSQTIIRNFSNLYNDQQEFKRISLLSFIEEIITLTKSETKEIPKKIEVVGFEKDEGIFIETNPTYLTQIIFNLVINAGQAIKSQPSRPSHHCINIQLMKNDQKVKISIRDDGPGVKTEQIGSIFNPFFTTKDSGTGLGLSICQNLAKQLGSKIHFENNYPSPGATFSLNLNLI